MLLLKLLGLFLSRRTFISFLIWKAAKLNSRGIATSDDKIAGFLERILTFDPKERPTIDQVISRLPVAPEEGKDDIEGLKIAPIPVAPEQSKDEIERLSVALKDEKDKTENLPVAPENEKDKTARGDDTDNSERVVSAFSVLKS
jgi:hypothetical protein